VVPVARIDGRATAVRATAALLSIGTIEIRSLARDLGRPALDGQAPTAEQSAAAGARIRMIAEILHGFPLLPLRPWLLGRERITRQELVWRWGSSPPAAREWIVTALAAAGPQFAGYPGMLEREHQRWLAKNPVRRPVEEDEV
jgi:hypothetical protein